MQTNNEKNKIIYEYLKEAYNSQKEITLQIDSRIGNYLVIIGFMLTISSCFAGQVIGLYCAASLSYFIISLILYIIANVFLIFSLWQSIRIFYTSKFFIPGVNYDSLKELLERNGEEVDCSVLLSDFALNYIDGYINNLSYSKKRSKISKSIKDSIRASVIFFIIFLSFLFISKIYQCESYAVTQAKKEEVKNENLKIGGAIMVESKKEPQDKPKDEAPKAEQPSARAKPEVIELGESTKDSVKKIISDDRKDSK